MAKMSVCSKCWGTPCTCGQSETENSELRGLLNDALTQLKAVEWVQPEAYSDDPDNVCPLCWGLKPKHTDDCPLAEVLRRADASGTKKGDLK